MNIIHGDCCSKLRSIPDASVQLLLTDPPYPGIPREYGTWNEEEWTDLMNAVMPEFRRVLTPTGSAIVILQPNSESAGRMRLWHLEFQATWGRKWNLVQDAYQWNHSQLPIGAATTRGLMRGSVKHCCWFGEPDCYRNQDAVLWGESEDAKRRKLADRAALAAGRPRKTKYTTPSAYRRKNDAARLDAARIQAASDRRGGVTPFNVIMAGNTSSAPGAAGTGHPSRTAPDLVRYWIRYLTKPGDTVLDPFAGSGTTLFVAHEEGRNVIGIEQNEKYVRDVREMLARTKTRKRA